MELNDLPEGAHKALWDAGVPLSKAWLTFAHPDDKAQWATQAKRSATKALAESAERINQIEGSFAEKLTAAISGPHEILTQRTELQKVMRAKILRYIANGYLHGLGFEPPRKLGDAPVSIPAELWNGRCDWDRNKLSANGIEIIEVRLLTNGMRDTVLNREPPQETQIKAVGRPGVGADIEAAFHALNRAGKIDVAESAKSHHDAVRRWLHDNRPGLEIPAKDLHPETIRKHFSPLFNALRETKKQ